MELKKYLSFGITEDEKSKFKKKNVRKKNHPRRNEYLPKMVST